MAAEILSADSLVSGAFSSVLLSLRIVPVFAFAPPFSMTQLPVLFRGLFGVAVAVGLVGANPAAAVLHDFGAGALVVVAAKELMLGGIFTLVLQLAYAALMMAGRVIDLQAGFGLALLIDPTSQAQTPVVGTLFAYAAAAVFFALDGGNEVLKIFAASLQAAPLGGAPFPVNLGPLLGYIASVFLVAFGVAGGAILCLFLADLTIAALARTTPQMNVLILGFQVKTLLLLIVLPLSFGAAGALLARLAVISLEALPRLI